VGDVWDVELAAPSSLIAPHIEDQLVLSGRRVAPQSGLEVWLRGFSIAVVTNQDRVGPDLFAAALLDIAFPLAPPTPTPPPSPTPVPPSTSP
jgi:hypothetical protein